MSKIGIYLGAFILCIALSGEFWFKFFPVLAWFLAIYFVIFIIGCILAIYSKHHPDSKISKKFDKFLFDERIWGK